MRPLGRKHQNKRHSVKKFKKHVSKTKARNVAPRPMRGGFRI